jgi:RHS repeat-associated protein
LRRDERGSIIAHANATAGVTQINKYDPYGIAGAGVSGRFRYAGAPSLAGAGGLYHSRARAYSPATGRFMQGDPILYAGGMNLYAYVGNDPVNFTDPLGLDRWTSAGGGCYQISVWVSTPIDGGVRGGYSPGPTICPGFGGPGPSNPTAGGGSDGSGGTSENGKSCGAAAAFLDSRAAAAALAAQQLKNLAPRLLAAAAGPAAFVSVMMGQTERDEPYILTHYTSGPGLTGILAAQAINPSTTGIYGSGVYASNIAPRTRSSADLDQIFTGGRDDFRYDHFVSFDARFMNVTQPDPANRPNVFFIPAVTPLNIKGRVTDFGENNCSSG